MILTTDGRDLTSLDPSPLCPFGRLLANCTRFRLMLAVPCSIDSFIISESASQNTMYLELLRQESNGLSWTLGKIMLKNMQYTLVL